MGTGTQYEKGKLLKPKIALVTSVGHIELLAALIVKLMGIDVYMIDQVSPAKVPWLIQQTVKSYIFVLWDFSLKTTI